MEKDTQNYIDTKFEAVHSELGEVKKDFNGFKAEVSSDIKDIAKKIDKNNTVMTNHVMDIKQKTAQLNGAVALAVEKAINADEKAAEAKEIAVTKGDKAMEVAVNAHQKADEAKEALSKRIIKILLTVIGSGLVGGTLGTVLLKLFS